MNGKRGENLSEGKPKMYSELDSVATICWGGGAPPHNKKTEKKIRHGMKYMNQ